MSFPAGFLWGAATSAYQIEGSPLADGAGPSNWHRFAHTPGRILDGATGDLACDHYRRFADDVRLMAELGLQAYRFSVSWSRVLPEGRGRINPKGLGFYERLVDALLAHGIAPALTLFHWDLPTALEDRGGWLNPDSADWFADYASVLFRALDDRVGLWITLNEPWVVTDAGYLHGVHPPGQRSAAGALEAAHQLLRAHGKAVQAYRAEGRQRIGITVNLEPKYPASPSAADLAATARADAYMNRQFLDPLLCGHYPDEFAEMFGQDWTERSADELAQIRQPIDFLGINYYSRAVTRHHPENLPLRAAAVPQTGAPRTAMDWEIYPQGLTDILAWVTARYGRMPIYITENGAALPDGEPADGGLDDPERIAYLRDHLCAAHAALENGTDLRGYFAWSLMDNFEWSQGFAKRFGIVHVDYRTQERTPKASARWYAEVIRSNGAILLD